LSLFGDKPKESLFGNQGGSGILKLSEKNDSFLKPPAPLAAEDKQK